jgi:hypothetical protein
MEPKQATAIGFLEDVRVCGVMTPTPSTMAPSATAEEAFGASDRSAGTVRVRVSHGDSFERILQAKILLASFLPGIVYMADAVGTQTETLMIRGLSVGVAIRKVGRLEVLTGLLVGLTLAVTFGAVGLVLWGEPSVVLTVSVAG